MKSAFFGILAIAAGFAATPALAATRSIVLPPGTIAAGLNATQLGYGVTLSSAANSTFIVPFVIPADYKEGTVLKLRLNFTSSSACAIVMKADFASRIRSGKQLHESTEGISPIGLITAVSPGNVVGFRKTFEIKGPKTASFTGVKPGDTYLIRFSRAKTDPGDTCSTAFIMSADVRYAAR